MVSMRGFQFPPNGKVLCKSSFQFPPSTLDLDVSGFNSLQTGKCFARKTTFGRKTTHTLAGFNSLQTGKVLCKTIKSFYGRVRNEHDLICFNSLQTGKCFASQTGRRPLNPCVTLRVSIPSKRESALQANSYKIRPR